MESNLVVVIEGNISLPDFAAIINKLAENPLLGINRLTTKQVDYPEAAEAFMRIFQQVAGSPTYHAIQLKGLLTNSSLVEIKALVPTSQVHLKQAQPYVIDFFFGQL